MRNSRFTLIELLTVIVIGLILMSMTLGIAIYVRNVGSTEKTRSVLARSVLLLENYRNDRGVYPRQTVAGDLWADVLNKSALGVARYRHTDTERPYVAEMVGPKAFWDGWGRPIRYICNPKSKECQDSPYLLWSKGPDGLDGSPFHDRYERENLDNIYSNE